MKKVLELAIKDDIKEIEKQNIEQLLSTFKYVVVAYLRAYFTFGSGHKVTIEARNIWIEFKNIIKSESRILRYIKKNTKTIDYDAVDDLLASLDEINEQTVIYYFDLIDSLEDACDTNQEWRITRPRRDFKTLIETDEYYLRALSLTLSMKDIEQFLGLPKEFFDYTESRSLTINHYMEEDAEHFYGVYPKVVDEMLVDYKVVLPEVVDDKTAAININLLTQAFAVYKSLGSSYTLDEKAVQEQACATEKQFIKSFTEKSF